MTILHSRVYFSPFRGFFTLLLRPCVPCALTYAQVWIATRCSDWSTCTRVILLLCGGVNGLRAVVTEAQNGEKINIQIHYNLIFLSGIVFKLIKQTYENIQQ